MHVTVSPSTTLTPAATVAAAAPGPAMKWMWATMGVLGVAVGALGAALVLQQPPAAQAQAPHTPIAGFSDQKVPEALMDKAQPAINNVAQGPATRAKPPAGPVDPIAPQRAATHPAMRTAPATPAAPASAAVCLRCGQVVSVQAVQQAAPPTGVGAVAGGVLGAVVGNQVGKGNGRAAATLLGAVGGGYVGHKVEERTRTHTVYQIAVRMDDGSMRRFQRAEPVAVGMPVVLQGQGFRVDPDGAGRAAETTPQPHRATMRVADAH